MNIVEYIKLKFQKLFDRIWNYSKCLEKAKRAFDSREIDKAQKYYQKVIGRLSKRRSLDATQRRYLGEAFVGRGNICNKGMESSSAIDYYIKALDNSISVSKLPDTAITLLAAFFCSRKDQSERAIEVFLRYIKLKPKDTTANQIYSILEGLCFIKESQDPHIRKKAMSLNQTVQSINPSIDWTYYYLGVGAYLEKDIANAQKHLVNGVKLNAKRALSYYWLGKTFCDVNQIEPAEEHFLRFVELIPDGEEALKQAEAYSYLGSAIIQNIGGFPIVSQTSLKVNRERLEKAAQYFERASLKNEKDENIFLNLARTLSLLNMHEPAISAYKKAIGIDNKNSEYFYLLAVELKKATNYQDAIRQIISAIVINDLDKYHYLLADLYLLMQNYIESEKECLKVYERGKNDDLQLFCILIYALYHQGKFSIIIEVTEKYTCKLDFNKKYPDVYYYVARAYSNANQFNKAIEWYIRLIDIKEREDAVYYLGCALANKGDYDRALTAFSRIIGKGTEFKPLAYLQCGIVYTKLGQVKDAEDSYSKAYSLTPQNSQLLYSAGLFYYLAADNEKALKYLSELLDIDPEHGAARFMMGHIHERCGEMKLAMTEYEALLSSNGLALQCRLRLGVLYFKQSDYEKAFEHLRHAYQSEDKSDALLFYYGLICALNNHFVLALQSWKELSDRHPEDERLKLNIYRVHYLLGCSYIKENKYVEAIQEWREYLKGYTEDIKTKQSLADLYFRLFASQIKCGNIQKAKDFLLLADELDGDNKKYSFYAALCDGKLGDLDECINHLDKLMATELDASRINYHKGVSLVRKGEKKKALQLFNELSCNGNDCYSYYAKWLIANEYILNGQYDNAIPILEALQC